MQFVNQGPEGPEVPMVERSAPSLEGPNGQAAKRPNGQAAQRPSPRTFVERADGRQLRRIQLYLASDVAKRLKHHCVERDVDMSRFVNEVLNEALSRSRG
jgi:hypothetical protein